MSEPLNLPRRLNAEELAKLAIDVVEGHVFMANSEESLQWTFAPLIAMARDVLTDAIIDETGAFYERMSKAAPRGVNGYPMFFSMQLLHKDDLPLVLSRMEEYEKMREGFVGESRNRDSS